MYEEKKKYLKSYLLQEVKINRYKQMSVMDPSRRDVYNTKIKNAIEIRYEIEEKIKNIDDDTLCELLFQKYVFGKTLEEISYILNYSKRHIERLHIKALEKIEI